MIFIGMKMQLNEVQKLQKIAGLLKEDDQQMFADLVDEIVGKANGDMSQEYDWTKEVLNDHGITDEIKIRGLYQYAIDTNHHRIADACKDILSNKKVFKEGEQTDKELYDLKQQFLPAFEDYVELYAIAALESEEGEYTDIEKDFARQLKDVLFKFKKGII